MVIATAAVTAPVAGSKNSSIAPYALLDILCYTCGKGSEHVIQIDNRLGVAVGSDADVLCTRFWVRFGDFDAEI